MATPAGELNLTGLLEPAAPVRPAPTRPKTRPPASGGLNLAGILEAPTGARVPAARAPRNPYSADDYNLEGDWSPERAESVRGWFKSTYGRDLPHRFGQTPTHDRMGLDHSSSMDVQLSPQSDEGRALASYLRENRIPFLAYNTAKPGAATGPHFHVGRPSRGLGASEAPGLNLDGALESAGDDGDGDVVRIEAGHSREQPVPPRLRQRQTFDPRTEEGRRDRDARSSLEHAPGAFLEVAVPLPSEDRLSDVAAGGEMMRAAYVRAARARGVPEEFAAKWVDDHGGARLSNTPDGPPVAPADALTDDALDASARTLRVRLAAPTLAQLVEDYKASGSNIGRAYAWATDPERSAGEKALDVAGPPMALAGRGVAAGADLARRAMKPADMFSARLWTRLGGGTAEQARAASDAVWNDEELPSYAENFVAEDVERDMSGINPRVGKAYGFLTRMLTDPTNLVPTAGAVKLADKFADAVKLARSARTAREIEAAAEAAELVVAEARLLTKARPLGLAGDAPAARAGVGGRVADVLTSEPEAFASARPLGLAGEPQNVLTAPVPESPETLGAQFRSAKRPDSPRVGVLVTHGELAPRKAPKGFAVVEVGEGALYLSRAKLRARGINSAAKLEEHLSQNGFEDLIGKVEPVADTSRGAALRTEDAAGRELSTSIVRTPEGAAAQAAEDLAQFPEAARQTVTSARDAAARRVAGPGGGLVVDEAGLRRKAAEHGISLEEARAAAVSQGYQVEGGARAALEARGYKVELVDAPNRAPGDAAGLKVWKVTDADGRVNVMRDGAELEDFAGYVAGRRRPAGAPLNLDNVLEASPTPDAPHAPRSSVEVAADIRTTHARERADFYAREAARATDPVRRAEFEALARDYADEAAEARVSDAARRVKAGEAVAPEEMADLERAVLAEDGEPVYIEVDLSKPSAAPSGRPRRAVRSPLRRAWDAGLDAYDASKSLFASADLSAAGRQSLFPLLFDTRAAVKGLGKGTPAALPGRQADFARWLDSQPAAKMWAEMGLDLDTLTGGHNEFFTSRIAERIPVYGPGVIQPSDRAMTAQLDAVRLMVAESWADELRAAGLTPAKNPEEFKAVAKLINAASGRAELGRAGQALYPVTRRIIFSPKLLKSRFTMINPLTYSRLPPATRKVAAKRLGKAAAKLAPVLGLAYLTADSVGLNPLRGDFMRARFGDTTYDLSGGVANKLRFVFQLVQSAGATAAAVAKGEPVEYKDTPFGVATHFLRSQLAPGYSVIPDAVTGETYDGKPFTWTEGVLRRITPGFAQDVYDGFVEGGGAVGAVKALPSFVGVSARTRNREEQKREWDAARSESEKARRRERTADVMKDAPAAVRDELTRLGVYVGDADAETAGRISDAVGRARTSPGWSGMKDVERKKFLENVIAGVRKEAGAVSSRRAESAVRAKEAERVALTGAAASEVERLGVVVDPVFAGHRVGTFDGESAGFRRPKPGTPPEREDWSLGQTPEMLGEYRRELAAATQAEVERVMSFGGYGSEPDAVKRAALQQAVDRVKQRVRGPFHFETRRRQYGERERLEEYQRELEGRSRQVQPGETLKLGEATPRPLMNTEGLRESANVEDRRGDSPGRAVAGSAVQGRRLMSLDGQRESVNVEDRRGVSPLVEEMKRGGASPVTETEAADVALLLEGLDAERFKRFARSLRETRGLGVVGESADAVFEGVARAVGALGSGEARGAAGVAGVRRLLAREMRLRPEQFRRDALAGKYGDRMREKAAEWFDVPFTGRPLASPVRDDLRRAVDEAEPDASPGFREFPDGAGDSKVPRASMPQIRSEHRGAMVNFLRGRGIAHTRETVPAGSLRPSQAEYSPEKVKKALGFEGRDRALLVSEDGHVADGHHQWLSKLYKGEDEPVEVIRLHAPILPLLIELARFTSSGVDGASAPA